MTIEEILAGESKNVEFKETLPEKSIKYMKSVVAFANGTGGKIIFGIADKTREVVGFDKEDVFKKMDAIANAVSDSCEPAIIPDITLQTVDGKTVIVVEVSEGRQRPYYIKALGRDGGVYVRVAGTTRLADEYMIKELLFEGSNLFMDDRIDEESDVEFAAEKLDSMYNTELFSFDIKKLAGFGKGGEKGFEGTMTQLQMQTYLCACDFRKRLNKKGAEYGWNVAVYSMPEKLWGYDHVTHVMAKENLVVIFGGRSSESSSPLQ